MGPSFVWFINRNLSRPVVYVCIIVIVRSNVSSVSDSDVGDQYSIIIIITIIIIINELMMVA